jgi:hypothetical protein
MTSQPSLVRDREPPEPTHACIRCGREGVAPENALCEDCNPLELAQPSATQVHGIAVVGIIVFVALLAVLGRLAIAGTGPFQGTVQGVVAADGGLAVTLVVTNQGSKAGATTCTLDSPSSLEGTTEVIQTPVIPANGDLTFVATATRFGTAPVALAATCESP